MADLNTEWTAVTTQFSGAEIEKAKETLASRLVELKQALFAKGWRTSKLEGRVSGILLFRRLVRELSVFGPRPSCSSTQANATFLAEDLALIQTSVTEVVQKHAPQCSFTVTCSVWPSVTPALLQQLRDSWKDVQSLALQTHSKLVLKRVLAWGVPPPPLSPGERVNWSIMFTETADGLLEHYVAYHDGDIRALVTPELAAIERKFETLPALVFVLGSVESEWELQRRTGKLTPEVVTEELNTISAHLANDYAKPDFSRSALSRIKELGSCVVINELVQNAVDCGAKMVNVVLHPDRLQIEHNGDCFSKADVKSVVTLSNSLTKAEGATIGFMGLGFKSVFSISRKVDINSGFYHFRVELKDSTFGDVLALTPEPPNTEKSRTIIKVYFTDQNPLARLRSEIEQYRDGTTFAILTLLRDQFSMLMFADSTLESMCTLRFDRVSTSNHTHVIRRDQNPMPDFHFAMSPSGDSIALYDPRSTTTGQLHLYFPLAEDAKLPKGLHVHCGRIKPSQNRQESAGYDLSPEALDDLSSAWLKLFELCHSSLGFSKLDALLPPLQYLRGIEPREQFKKMKISVAQMLVECRNRQIRLAPVSAPKQVEGYLHIPMNSCLASLLSDVCQTPCDAGEGLIARPVITSLTSDQYTTLTGKTPHARHTSLQKKDYQLEEQEFMSYLKRNEQPPRNNRYLSAGLAHKFASNDYNASIGYTVKTRPALKEVVQPLSSLQTTLLRTPWLSNVGGKLCVPGDLYLLQLKSFYQEGIDLSICAISLLPESWLAAELKKPTPEAALDWLLEAATKNWILDTDLRLQLFQILAAKPSILAKAKGFKVLAGGRWCLPQELCWTSPFPTLVPPLYPEYPRLGDFFMDDCEVPKEPTSLQAYRVLETMLSLDSPEEPPAELVAYCYTNLSNDDLKQLVETKRLWMPIIDGWRRLPSSSPILLVSAPWMRPITTRQQVSFPCTRDFADPVAYQLLQLPNLESLGVMTTEKYFADVDTSTIVEQGQLLARVGRIYSKMPKSVNAPGFFLFKSKGKCQYSVCLSRRDTQLKIAIQVDDDGSLSDPDRVAAVFASFAKNAVESQLADLLRRKLLPDDDQALLAEMVLSPQQPKANTASHLPSTVPRDDTDSKFKPKDEEEADVGDPPADPNRFPPGLALPSQGGAASNTKGSEDTSGKTNEKSKENTKPQDDSTEQDTSGHTQDNSTEQDTSGKTKKETKEKTETPSKAATKKPPKERGGRLHAAEDITKWRLQGAAGEDYIKTKLKLQGLTIEKAPSETSPYDLKQTNGAEVIYHEVKTNANPKQRQFLMSKAEKQWAELHADTYRLHWLRGFTLPSKTPTDTKEIPGKELLDETKYCFIPTHYAVRPIEMEASGKTAAEKKAEVEDKELVPAPGKTAAEKQAEDENEEFEELNDELVLILLGGAPSDTAIADASSEPKSPSK